MQELALLFLGAVGAGASYVSLSRASDDQLLILAGLIGTVTWLLFAYSALAQVDISANGVITPQPDPALAVWGVMMAAPNFYVALTGPLEIIKNPRQLQSEVS